MQFTGRSHLKLYNDRGHRLSLDTRQLIAINHLREPSLPAEVRYTVGRYWLVGCAVPLQPALVEMLVFKAPTNGRAKHHVAFATEGIAGYEHFDLDAVIVALNSKNRGLGEPYDTPVPQSVVDAARAKRVAVIAADAGDQERVPAPVETKCLDLLI